MASIRINHRLLPEEEANVSVRERGFRFGDGLFETIGVHGGMPYLWRYHRERLDSGLDALHMAYGTAGLLAQAMELLAVNALREGILRISISRGIGSRGYLPLSPVPTLVMETAPPPPAPPDAPDLWLSRYEKPSPRALPTHCKLSQGVNSTLARMEAAQNGCFDALQLGAAGHVAEAGSANLFWLKGGRLYTPALSTGALAGVTRRRIMELSPLPVEEGEYSLDALQAAESVILTNATYGVLPVRSVKQGATLWESRALADRFNRLRREDIASDTRALRESLART